MGSERICSPAAMADPEHKISYNNRYILKEYGPFLTKNGTLTILR